MEVQNSEQGHMIEIRGDVPAAETSLGGSTICGGAACGFSDAQTSYKDAKERATSMQKLLMAVVLCIVFMSVEVAGGIKANSLAILTDAAHLLSDVAAFAISLFSLWASGWEANPRQSYGFFRIEILGALVSIQLIWLLAGILVYEAIARLIHDTGEVQGFLMFVVSAFGLVVNVAMALLLGHDHGHHHGHDHNHGHAVNDHDLHDHSHSHDSEPHNHGLSITSHHQHQQQYHHHHHHHGSNYKVDDEHHHTHEADHLEPLLKTYSDRETKPESGARRKERNINVQGAYLHVLGDSIQSIGVMIGGAIIWYKPGWKIIDLICTLVFSVIVLGTTIRMLRNILEVLMESTPREIDATRLEKGLCEMDDVVAIHELHIWAITVGKVLLACHVLIKREADADTILNKVIDYIRREYNISHVTIQIERQ
ncbi:metal tolerance protein 1-like [Durio zibethinus]|uniref:Metal tolerance protein 1-like n=1 Tax=Durio zibethinus TaxID=66656 RepID=A0A6P5X1V7_DURZI|nr:metal tolerance protein 1-like [Durio zibethinus]XP_022722172.1 metal tolerance protein 1-like [Durio zibethinus]